MNAANRARGVKGLPEDSVAKRYGWKLAANGVGLPLLALIQACSARLLGPSALGEFSYVSNAFSQLFSFLEAGSSEGLYTKLAQRPEERALLQFYSIFALLLLAIGIGITAMLLLSGFQANLFPSITSAIIWLGLFYAFAVWASQIIQRIVDCYGLTVRGEINRTAARLIAATVIGVVFLLSTRLSIEVFFLYQFFVVGLTVVGWIKLLGRHGIHLTHPFSRTIFSTYTREFASFSGPLVGYSIVSLASGFFDRWFLQRVAGSEQQGYFTFGSQIAMFCFVFSSAMVPIFVREFSRAFAADDNLKMRSLFNLLLPRLFAITGILGMFAAMNAESITTILGGSSFKNATATVLILALYPLHQTFGQFSGSLFYITGQTRLYRNIGIASMTIGGILTVFLVGPRDVGAMQLGAYGLAIKTVCQQLILVCIQLWYNCRFLKTSFANHIWIQFRVILMLGLFALSARYVSTIFIDTLFPQVIFSGAIYTACCLGAMLLRPQIFGFDYEEIRELITKAALKLASIRVRPT